MMASSDMENIIWLLKQAKQETFQGSVNFV